MLRFAAHGVHGRNRAAVCDEPSGRGVEDSGVLGVAVQEDDDAAFAADRAPGVVKIRLCDLLRCGVAVRPRVRQVRRPLTAR